MPGMANREAMMLNKYYFTFGTDPKYPYYGGWVTVIAEDIHQAVRFFRARFNTEQLHCADYYTAEQFRKTEMYTKGNFGHYSHEVIGIIRRKK